MDEATHLSTKFRFHGQHIAIIADSDNVFLQHMGKFIDQRTQTLLQALIGTADVKAQLTERRTGRIQHLAIFTYSRLDTAHNLRAKGNIGTEGRQQRKRCRIELL